MEGWRSAYFNSVNQVPYQDLVVKTYPGGCFFGGLTVSTGQSEFLTTLSAVLPKIKWFSPVLPWVPITMISPDSFCAARHFGSSKLLS
jgi:hypothetical protein